MKIETHVAGYIKMAEVTSEDAFAWLSWATLQIKRIKLRRVKNQFIRKRKGSYDRILGRELQG
jgi:hypothetical protein